MIVKDEEAVIEQSLHFTLPHVNSWCIIDTGSTDKTKELIQKITADYKVPGTLYERPWVNFGHNRSEALELARKEKATWLFMMDADDIFVGTFPKDLPQKDGYTIQLVLGTICYRRILLFNSSRPWMYKFPIHEYPYLGEVTDLDNLPESQCSIQCRTIGSRSQNPNKYSDDAILLEKEFERGEFEQRAAFYAAQSWKDAGNVASAIQWYLIRVSLGGWKEEIYISYLNLIRLTDDIQLKLDYAWKGLSICPERKEVPHALLESFRKASVWHIQAYAIGLLAFRHDSQNKEASLFIEPDVYTYKFYDEFSLTAFYTGHTKESQDSIQLALKGAPKWEEERILENIKHIFS
jgi:glycosyltransferase involved in cell wall biosynthesis